MLPLKGHYSKFSLKLMLGEIGLVARLGALLSARLGARLGACLGARLGARLGTRLLENHEEQT